MPTSVKLSPSDKVGNARFGWSMALSADGKTAVIGGSADNNMLGAVWVFIRSGDNWIQQAKLVAADAAPSVRFGSSVALSADGYTLMVGGEGNAWKFSPSDDGVWQEAWRIPRHDANGARVESHQVQSGSCRGLLHLPSRQHASGTDGATPAA